jgi:hypothetical protein
MSRAVVSFPSSWMAAAWLSFPLDTQPLIVLSASSMSNAESDRKPDGSAEDDDEPDEWCV